MKLSIFKLSSVAIALPLIVVSLIAATPAGAEQIDRSRSRMEEPTPSVTDLNLSIPTDREQPDLDPETPAKPTRKNPITTDRESKTATTTEQPIKVKSIRRRSIVATNLNSSTSTVVREGNRSKSSSRHRIAAVSPPPLGGNYLRLVRDPSKGTNDNGNPIYTLEAYVGGERYQTFSTVSGIASSQQFDRNIGNNHAPLPDGLYRVSDQIVPGAVPEVGRTFIGIYPQFQTNRSDLGIHVDPSFNKKNGSDGTSGCIGLTTTAERDAINDFVLKYHPHNLYVSITSKSDRE
jgi:hypothetical protein